jgi:phosphotriesterase-related protein
VCCTGAWIAPQRYFHHRAPREIAELFIGDLLDGIAGTDIRAGIIKCATEQEGLTEPIERVLRASAIAHRATGAVISTHSHAPSRSGELQQQIFEDEGVDLSRVIVGHSGDTEDLDYLTGLVAHGSYVGMDRFGSEAFVPDHRRMDVVAALCRAGHADRVMLSHDANCFNDRSSRQQLAQTRPNWHHRHILERILPGLLERGVTQAQIDTMLIANPRSIFESTQKSV